MAGPVHLSRLSCAISAVARAQFYEPRSHVEVESHALPASQFHESEDMV
jgi:hypothetical protein